MNVHTSSLKPSVSAKLTPTSSVALQRKCPCGNHTIAGRECTECTQTRIQRKLAIGASKDPLEYEADRIADQVSAAPGDSAVTRGPMRIQRYAGKATKGVDVAPATVDHVLETPGQPLPPMLLQNMEQRFGHDFFRVRVLTGAHAQQSALDMNAHAYAVGRDVVFGARHYAPHSREGQKLIAHD